jgi:NADPH:quinone reductase-like Zn-dependent oxidoreductase
VSQTLRPLMAKEGEADLRVLTELIEAGQLSPVVDRTYLLSEAPEAVRYVNSGIARGKVVITMG